MTIRCPCLQRDGRLCEPCWRREFEQLRAEARADDVKKGWLGVTLEAPRPEAREAQVSMDDVIGILSGKKKRRVGGYHPTGESRLVDVERPQHQGRYVRNMRRRRMRGERSAYPAPDPTQYQKWVCPQCGPLNPKLPPLLGEDDEYHCSSLDCDAVVHDALAIAVKVTDDDVVAVDETAADDRPEMEPTPEAMGVVSVVEDDAPSIEAPKADNEPVMTPEGLSIARRKLPQDTSQDPVNPTAALGGPIASP